MDFKAQSLQDRVVINDVNTGVVTYGVVTTYEKNRFLVVHLSRKWHSDNVRRRLQ